jgi:hypothetical protein
MVVKMGWKAFMFELAEYRSSVMVDLYPVQTYHRRVCLVILISVGEVLQMLLVPANTVPQAMQTQQYQLKDLA